MANLWKVTGKKHPFEDCYAGHIQMEKYYTDVRKSCHSFRPQGQRALHVKTLFYLFHSRYIYKNLHFYL